MTEQFEQAKREFAEKWGMDLHRKKILLSDLTALLEQHKEVILRDELEKFGTYFNEIRCPYVVTSVIDEYLKNVKK